MPKLIDTRDVIDDNWIHLADDEALNSQSKIIVNFERLKRDWQQLRNAQLAIGVELKPDDVVADLSFCVDELKLIVLQFDSFADGRAFSQAKMLRDRYHYTGEIRAIGEVIRDQLGFMQRCGFSQFEIAESEDSLLALQAFSEITHGYQSDLIRSVRH
jgi:uncharacterized protein (DUF934 family)